MSVGTPAMTSIEKAPNLKGLSLRTSYSCEKKTKQYICSGTRNDVNRNTPMVLLQNSLARKIIY